MRGEGRALALKRWKELMIPERSGRGKRCQSRDLELRRRKGENILIGRRRLSRSVDRRKTADEDWKSVECLLVRVPPSVLYLQHLDSKL